MFAKHFHACCIVGFLTIFQAPAEAHDIYTHLKDSSGRSCCSNADCRAVPYRTTSSGVQMLVNGAWIWVPSGKIEYRLIDGDSGVTGGGHWCGEPFDGGHITYCAFLPPSMAFSTQSPR